MCCLTFIAFKHIPDEIMANDDLSKLKIDKSQPAFRKARGRKKTIYIAAGISVLIIIILVATGIFSPAVKVDAASVVQVYPSQSFTLLNASGYVVPQRKAAVASKVTGRLVELFVEEGSRIKNGQIVARLENDDLTASLRQAEANLKVSSSSVDQAKAELNDAKVNYEREKRLLAKEFTTKASHDVAEARYKKALAGLAGAEASVRASQAAARGARVSLDYTYIRAPFDAVVLTKSADVGDIVTPIGAATNAKASVVTIADMSSLQVEADVAESNIGKLKVGQPCQIQLDAIADTRFDGTIHMIVPTADRTKATVMVKVKFNSLDGRVLPEMSAKVAFLSREVKENEKKPRTAVNRNAIVEHSGKKYVFLIRQGRTVLAPVTTGIDLGDMVELTGGAASGDKVVLNPPKRLSGGARVRINEQ